MFPKALGGWTVLAGSKHQWLRDPGCVTSDPLCHPVCLASPRDAETGRARSNAWVVPAFMAAAFASPAHASLLLPPASFPCSHCAVGPPLVSPLSWSLAPRHNTVTISVCQSHQRILIIFFFLNIVKRFPPFSYFIIMSVTPWPLCSEPVILQNKEKTLCSSYDVWFPWWCVLFIDFHSCLQCSRLCTDVCYTPFLSINHCL